MVSSSPLSAPSSSCCRRLLFYLPYKSFYLVFHSVRKNKKLLNHTQLQVYFAIFVQYYVETCWLVAGGGVLCSQFCPIHTIGIIIFLPSERKFLRARRSKTTKWISNCSFAFFWIINEVNNDGNEKCVMRFAWFLLLQLFLARVDFRLFFFLRSLSSVVYYVRFLHRETKLIALDKKGSRLCVFFCFVLLTLLIKTIRMILSILTKQWGRKPCPRAHELKRKCLALLFVVYWWINFEYLSVLFKPIYV